MVKKWPHSGTLTYLATGTYDSNGIYTNGAETSIVIEKCLIQQRGGSSDYIINDSGDRIKVSYAIYIPRFDNDEDILAEGLQFAFGGNSYLILDYWVYQKRVMLKC